MDKKKILLVSLGHLSCDVNGGALPATLPYLRAAHNLDYQATGGFMLAYSCLSSLIQPFFGLLADKHSKPWFIPLGVLLAGFGLALMGFLGNYWAIFICIAISGVGSAFFHPEGARFVNRVSGEQKGAAMSFFSIGGNSGFIIGPILVTAFVGTFGLYGMSVFAVMALIMAAFLIVSISRMQPISPDKNKPKQSETDNSINQNKIAEEKHAKKTKNNWREFSKLMVCIICRAINFTGCNTFIPLYWISVFDQSKAAGAMALVIFGGCGIACNILGGFLSDKYGYVSIIRIAYTLMGPAILIFSLVNNLYLAYALLPFLGCALYLPFSSQVVLGQKLLAKNIGFASGVTLGLATTLGGIAQPALGWIADNYSMHTVFYTLAFMGMIGALFSYFLSRKQDN